MTAMVRPSGENRKPGYRAVPRQREPRHRPMGAGVQHRHRDALRRRRVGDPRRDRVGHGQPAAVRAERQLVDRRALRCRVEHGDAPPRPVSNSETRPGMLPTASVRSSGLGRRPGSARCQRAGSQPQPGSSAARRADCRASAPCRPARRPGAPAAGGPVEVAAAGARGRRAGRHDADAPQSARRAALKPTGWFAAALTARAGRRLSPDERTLAVCNIPAPVSLFDTGTRRRAAVLDPTPKGAAIHELAFSPDGGRLAVAHAISAGGTPRVAAGVAVGNAGRPHPWRLPREPAR